MLYSVVLAGIPGRITLDVLSDLRKRFSEGYLFRAHGFKLRSDKRMLYDAAAISSVLSSSVDAVFGKSNRPFGFCRNQGRPCAIKNASKKSCGKDGNGTCGLKKPDYFILIYQEGLLEEALLSPLHYSAFSIKIPTSCYNNRQKTVDEVVKAIAHTKSIVGAIEKSIESSNSPFLLPPSNFRSSELRNLLKVAPAQGVTATHNTFRRLNFDKVKRAYQGRRNIIFSPAYKAIRHGIPSAENKEELAISHEYRLGCKYPSDFQYDVMRVDEKHFDGTMSFSCRDVGDVWPKTKHVNISVDDCII